MVVVKKNFFTFLVLCVWCTSLNGNNFVPPIIEQVIPLNPVLQNDGFVVTPAMITAALSIAFRTLPRAFLRQNRRAAPAQNESKPPADHTIEQTSEEDSTMAEYCHPLLLTIVMWSCVGLVHNMEKATMLKNIMFGLIPTFAFIKATRTPISYINKYIAGVGACLLSGVALGVWHKNSNSYTDATILGFTISAISLVGIVINKMAAKGAAFLCSLAS